MKAMSRKDSGISCMSGNLSTSPYDNIQLSDRLQGSTKSTGKPCIVYLKCSRFD